MYFVTTKRAGYALFCTTPSERAAVAVPDTQDRVHLLEHRGDEWTVRAELPMSQQSHTDILVRFADIDEPATVDEFLRLALGPR